MAGHAWLPLLWTIVSYTRGAVTTVDQGMAAPADAKSNMGGGDGRRLGGAAAWRTTWRGQWEANLHLAAHGMAR